jgi:quinol monooxygenase YgiN
MKKFVLVVFATVFMVACCNQGNKTCKEKEEGKACCKKTEEHACCKAEPAKLISARFFIKADKVADFVASAKTVIEQSRAEEGNVSYSLFQDPEDATKFLFFEVWKNQAAIDTHFATAHFIKFSETAKDLISQPADITVYDTVAEKKAE